MAIDWSRAPEGAEFFAASRFRKIVDPAKNPYFFSEESQRWSEGSSMESMADCIDWEYRPRAMQQWPEESRIDIIATNGNDGMHYDEQREQHEQAKPAAPQANKYDRTILGKYGSGKCTVDVYRVLNAFPSGSPEIDHALKKLLAPGKRGVKSELQDLREAIQSIEARIDYLKELGK
jgi:hypothetical protein